MEAIPAAHVDFVQISFQDLVFGIRALEVTCDLHFFDLADHAALEADLVEHVASELLRDRASPASVVEGQHADHRPRDADGVEAAVLVEALVLDRDDGMGDIVRHGVDRHRRAALKPDFVNLTAVEGEQLARLLVLEGSDLRDGGAAVAGADVLPGAPYSADRARDQEDAAQQVSPGVPEPTEEGA